MIAASEAESQPIHAAFEAAAGALSDEARTIASTIGDVAFPGALVPVPGGTELYAVAPTYLQWRRLAPLLEARIGRELSDFAHLAEDGVPPEALTALLGGYAPARWRRVRLPAAPERRKAATAACLRLVENVRRNAGAFLAAPRTRSAGELLADFEDALARGAPDDAEPALEELRRRELLDGLNLRCLALRLAVERGPGESPDVVALVRELRGVRLPRNVRAIVERVAGVAPPG